jgi:hypothetical protein
MEAFHLPPSQPSRRGQDCVIYAGPQPTLPEVFPEPSNSLAVIRTTIQMGKTYVANFPQEDSNRPSCISRTVTLLEGQIGC